ncbi:MAG: hypothetical protein RE472_03090 [Thermoplasmatales archaeon]|nr:MAG: hypothetical protein RE472_09840 [Thermoplasmatales archaeon]WMT49964.1 MAG: hypothetical protein RE472_03090 [Thermoplasmatales archaeon]
MVEKWITKKDGTNESKHVKIETSKKTREVMVSKMEPSAGQLEKQAWAILGDLSKVTTVDQLLLQMRKYSGTLGDYSGFNSLLIGMQAPNATIVRSMNEWRYFGRELNSDAIPISVLYPVGVSHKDGPGRVKDFIEKKRKEGLSDEAIEELVREKFNLSSGGFTKVFSTGKVYDISQTTPIPGKSKPVEEDIKTATLYRTLKKIARDHYTVEESVIDNGARGYTAHSGEGQKIVVMKIPGEDVNVLHTLIHEMSHARLEHLNRKDIPRGIAESEAELSTYLVGAHFGFDFRDDSAAYIKGWLDDPQNKGKKLDKENLDRVLNNARWLINQITNKIGEAQ